MSRIPRDRAYRELCQAVRASSSICHVCNQPIDPTLRYPHPMSGSVDHVTPRSKGGAVRDPANMRPAHLRHNIQRGNRDLPTIQPPSSRQW